MQGEPKKTRNNEVAYGAEFLRWFSEETVRDYGRYLAAPKGKNKILVQHKPAGPCLLITPSNFPLAMATRKVAPGECRRRGRSHHRHRRRAG
ncbi:aldehyde dehydrogenase family protein [Arthrobacter sp. cf158]|uniref:aldehyde dehydrogenase family protein n=1 Tax=Arthrobacter sp. cf158 TaxID=1761744 RepID=UPI0034A5A1B2